MGTFIGLSIYVPVYFELALGLSASQSGLALIPLMVRRRSPVPRSRAG